MTVKQVPVLLITGYLGSGKTTLVNKILTNKKGIRFAVIVNDIGEVNIDAALIQQGGVVNQQDDSLVALQNGCICCTLKMDLIEQITGLLAQECFDYIVIEASGICEPAPIAQTICSIPAMGPGYIKHGVARLDSIVTVVDALRMKDEFGNGEHLTRLGIEEDDLENLVIQQLEFCNIILLNKASEVSLADLDHVTRIIRAIQPKAEIIPCDYGDVELDRILDTGRFDFDDVATSAAWIEEIERRHDDDEHADDHHGHANDGSQPANDHHEHAGDGHGHADDHHGHHHHHHHHDHDHGEGEAEEYGIGTFVYYRRRPLDLARFDEFVARFWPKGVIRCKGMCWFADEPDVCYLFEQAGRQMGLKNAGQWYATMPEEELRELFEREAGLRRDWDDTYGDRMQKLVFIGQHMDKDAIAAELDKCLLG